MEEKRNCPWCESGHDGPKHVDSKDCVFCNFTDKDVVIYEDNLFTSFLSRAPLNNYHAIIVPKKHYIDTYEIPDEVLAKMYILAKKITKAIKQASKADGVSWMHDDGTAKTAEHFTLHLFPRYKKDNICGHYVRQEDPGLIVRAQYTEEIKKFL